MYNVNGPTGGPVYNVGLQVGLCIMQAYRWACV